MARLKSLRLSKMEPLHGFTKTMGTVSQKNSRSACLSRSTPPRVSEGARAWVLSIIMNLVTGSFGGTMELTSEKNKGVRFEVRFPAQATMSNDPMHTAVLTAQS